MKFNIYLELGTRAQTLKILDLLRFPLERAFGGETRWLAQWWSGETRRKQGDRDKIIQRIASEGLNELQLRCRTHAGGGHSNDSPSIMSADLWLTPSPTSQLWASVPSTPSENHTDERNRLTFGGGRLFAEEYAHKYHLPYPSVVEYSLEIQTGEKIDNEVALQAMSIEILRSAMPEVVIESDIFGYGCVGGRCRKQMMLHSLGGVPAWTDQLGEKFENVYPILIGPVASCQGLAALLGDRCSLILLSEQAPSAIVSIRPDKVEEVRRDPAVKEWVVIRDISRLDAPAATLHEIYERRKAIAWEAPFVKR